MPRGLNPYNKPTCTITRERGSNLVSFRVFKLKDYNTYVRSLKRGKRLTVTDTDTGAQARGHIRRIHKLGRFRGTGKPTTFLFSLAVPVRF